MLLNARPRRTRAPSDAAEVSFRGWGRRTGESAGADFERHSFPLFAPSALRSPSIAFTSTCSVRPSPPSSAPTRPSLSTTTRVHIASRSPRSDDDTITVRPSRASPASQLVDRHARADVDARGRLRKDEQLRIASEAPRHDDLLLVAAAERRDQRVGARRHDPEPLGPALDELLLSRLVEPPARPEPVEYRERHVLADRKVRDDRLVRAVGGDEWDPQLASIGDIRRFARALRQAGWSR